MSDYLFSSNLEPQNFLKNTLSSIYLESPPEIQEFRGKWGSLAVSNSFYSGFKPYESDQHLMIVIGAPVLYFRDNDFLVSDDSSEGTQSIYERWKLKNKIIWDEDLSGPFNIILIDKLNNSIEVITDLMAFIPVYHAQETHNLYLGTHVDALATIANKSNKFDSVSLADFVINDTVTYPFTAYEGIRQLAPSSRTFFSSKTSIPVVKSYWEPLEYNPYHDIKTASIALRKGVNGYINRITKKMDKVAHFVSAGEDSRALSGLLPQRLERDGYVFLDTMNREGKIAQKVANLYNINLNIGFRNNSHYLDILPQASKLIGAGHQYHHAHSLGFDRKFKLAAYPAVFGGYLADSLIKAPYATQYFNTLRYPFLPEIPRTTSSLAQNINNSLFRKDIIEQVKNRRSKRFEDIKALRPNTATEWFVLYPASMRVAISNYYTTRRLFCSYEPFMCKESVKISAAVPIEWKLNRRLFLATFKPYLNKSKWLFHADGRLPYFGWAVNKPLQTPIWMYRQISKRLGLNRKNQGPWADWQKLSASSKWEMLVNKYNKHPNLIDFLAEDKDFKSVLNSQKHLTPIKRGNLLQVAFHKCAHMNKCDN